MWVGLGTHIHALAWATHVRRRLAAANLWFSHQQWNGASCIIKRYRLLSHRFWGTPIPIWASEDGEEIRVIGSIAELEEVAGRKVGGTFLFCYIICYSIVTPKLVTLALRAMFCCIPAACLGSRG
jgi:hypothetical protein